MIHRLLFSLAFAAAAGVGAREQPPRPIDVTEAQRTGSEVTVYADGRALVRERFEILLQGGTSRIVFRHLPRKLDPDSILLSGEGIETLGITYDRHLLTPRRLLQAHVGDLVRILRIDPATGEEISQAAEILSATDGLVVRIGDRIVTDPQGQLVYSRVPDDLHRRPVLEVLVRGTGGSRPHAVDLVYLTRGLLRWHMEYSARLHPDGTRLDLTGWAVVDNDGPHDFGPVALALVAGRVNDAESSPPPRGARALAAATPPPPERLGGAYRIYRFDRPWRLTPHSTRRRPLIAPRPVRVTRRYVFSGGAHGYTTRIDHAPARQHALVRVDFPNTAEAGLGVPLPAGRVHVYEQAGGGSIRLLGVGRLSNVPEGGEVQLRLGRAFDVWAERRQTDYRVEEAPVPRRRQYTSRHEVRLHNALDTPVTAWVEEPLPGQWTITGENTPHERLDAARVRWSVEIPARGERLLTYTVRVLQ